MWLLVSLYIDYTDVQKVVVEIQKFNLLWINTTIKMTTMPAKPATPISRHNKQATIIVRTGAVHNTFKHKLIISNRLTSFDKRFTTFPDAVSPSAVWDNRKT